MALGDYRGPGRPTKGSSRDAQALINATCKAYGLTFADLVDRNIDAKRCAARFSLYDALYTQLHWSLPAIGRLMKRDHTSILYGIERYRGKPPRKDRRDARKRPRQPKPKPAWWVRACELYADNNAKTVARLLKDEGYGTVSYHSVLRRCSKPPKQEQASCPAP